MLELFWPNPEKDSEHAISVYDGDDDDDDVLYSAVTPCYCSMLGRVVLVSFEACCQWVLLSVQITIVTLPYYYIYCTEVRLSFCQ